MNGALDNWPVQFRNRLQINQFIDNLETFINYGLWLFEALFEQKTGVLSSAAIKGQVDYLLGLKENVIIGRLIPVTNDLIEKYYGNYLSKYAHNQPVDKKEERKED